MTPKKKLIEVALPLPEINDASAYDKMPGIGPHPKGIHHWWARLPLPTARAVLFASVVDDPSSNPEKWPTLEAQNAERERLFDILREMMRKKLHEQPAVYARAHAEMLKHCDGKLPAVFDPFAGGGSIPLEANRLGFEAHASDLNPVAVLLNKCNLELAPRWMDCPPVNPVDRTRIGGGEASCGTHGLAADVRYYGRLIADRARAKIGHLYPKVSLGDNGSGEANVIAWLWARTVASQDPAAREAHVPLLSTFWLSAKGKLAWLDPVVDPTTATYRFQINTGLPTDKAKVSAGTKMGRASFRCILSGTPLEYGYIRSEAKAQKLGYRLTCIVAEAKGGRIYLPADSEHERLGRMDVAQWKPEEQVTTPCHDVDRLPMYGMPKWGDAFTPRQLAALTELIDLVRAVRTDIEADSRSAGMVSDEAIAYANSVSTFLSLAVDRTADFNASVCRWSNTNQKIMNVYGRQAIPMSWDFGEANTLGDSVGAWTTCCDYVANCVKVLTVGNSVSSKAAQADAATGASGVERLLVSTDPPYYDNIGYAALSDFFYVWLRRSVGDLYPDLFGTILVPKMRELTASPERFDGDKQKAKEHFESGFRHAFTNLRERLDSRFPLTVYYAFKQDDEEENASDNQEEATNGVDLTTGWETLLEALISSGFQITGTWPVRASQKWRMRAMGSNALASYIVLACRPRASTASRTDRRSFVADLKRELPSALRNLQQGNIAPVDFAQAAIGPGMAVYSRYASILESTGKAMTVRTALSLINQTLTEVLSEVEDDFDAETRWSIAWFEQHGFDEGGFGDAELLSKAKVTAVGGLQQAGLIHSKGGHVRLLRPTDLPKDWDPAKGSRLTIWEMTHHLLRVYHHEKAGDVATADLLRKIGTQGELARDLAYRLFNVCEKKKRSQEALAYNALVLGWPEIARLAREGGSSGSTQSELFDNEVKE